MRGLGVGGGEGAVQAFFPAVVGGDGDVADVFVLAGALQRDGEPARFAVDGDAVAVDPAAVDVVDVVEDDEGVDGGQQLPVAQIRKEVGLHDGHFLSGGHRCIHHGGGAIS